MRLALEAAEQSGIMLPVAAAANDMYKKVNSLCRPYSSAPSYVRCRLLLCRAMRYGEEGRRGHAIHAFM